MSCVQALAALDVLSMANLVNYFGKCDRVRCMPSREEDSRSDCGVEGCRGLVFFHFGDVVRMAGGPDGRVRLYC